jgi:hypothetical protein
MRRRDVDAASEHRPVDTPGIVLMGASNSECVASRETRSRRSRPLSNDQHAVAEEIEAVFLPHDLAIGGKRELLSGEGGDEHQVA